MKKRLLLLLALNVVAVSLYAQTGNTGIGTTSPTTRLDVNGAITTREGTDIAVSGTAVTVPNLAFSQYRLTGAPTADFTITGPTTSDGSLALVAGARMILVNTTTQIGNLNGFSILPGAAQEFAFTDGSWVGTNNGGQPDYDWMKAGNLFPTAAGDTSANIYHIGGRVGVGTSNPVNTLHVTATADESNVLTNNIVARFDPFGGQHIDKPASILVNGGRAIFGYDLEPEGGKYAFIRGNEAADVRLQVIDENAVLYPKAFFISGNHNPGFVGINNDAPQSQLDINGQVKITDGTEGAGKVLTSDAVGGASWQNPLAGSMIEGTTGNQVNIPSGTSQTYSGGSITFPRAGTYMVYARWRMLSPSTSHPSGTHAFVNTALSTSASSFTLAGIATQWVFISSGQQNTIPGFRVTVTNGQTLYFWFHTGFFAGDLEFLETYAIGPF